ncbi:pyrroloquinoline quinone precursor peptide PqqA [Streptomyces sp. NPDC048644]|uniref:pyrroloquinoline quinone precursor peptide PqqA n=1 Tax=Streptomyces sp. NPDC048644 TaxID=3365582 RepID=UPI00371DCAE7
MTSLQAVPTAHRAPHTPQTDVPKDAPRSHDSGTRTATAWHTPGYTVIDTALEVTAYRLTDR